MFKKLFCALLVCLPPVLFSQVDFNNYRTLQSSGEIPTDFTLTSKSKMEEDLKNSESELTGMKKVKFYEGVNYAIDNILHSGDVVYGDPISTYASEVVDRLLKDDPTLRSKLRIYTIKSNAANAFSTDQGILFITTGLIAQLTSEAQLAYILAHEISHYTEKHVIETYSWQTKKSNNSLHIEKLSNYSKEKEFEADKLGLTLYNKAGYAVDAIYETFDVLMYSYLPFEEIEFPKNYFNTANIFLPDYLFPTEKYEIKAEEDYDDSESSHPNIKKRKEAVTAEIGTFANWGAANFSLGEIRFTEIRNIARFENLRTDIVDANLGDALYSSFILERSFPNSMYLKRMKAQIWLNLLNYKNENKVNDVLDANKELEGESAAIHFFLKKLTKEGMMTIALRQIYDLQKTFPDNKELKAVYDRCVVSLARTEKFKKEMYSTKTFEEALADFELHKGDSIKPEIVDTVAKKSDSKYSKIKSKKNADNPNNFDTTKFYLYGIGDILKDSTLWLAYDAESKVYQVELDKQKEIDALSYRERKKLKSKKKSSVLNLGIDEMIVVEPKVFSYRGNQGFDPQKSEKIENNYSEVIQNVGDEVGLKVHSIDRRILEKGGTVAFNERSILIAFLSQLVNDDDVNVFPVDFELLSEIQNNYGTANVMFSIVEHQRKAEIKWGWLGMSIFILPAMPIIASIHIPMAIFKANKTEMTVLVMNLEKGTIDAGGSYYFNEPIYKLNLGAHIYDIFMNMKQPSK
ncbi:MAG: M48 family metallopeptidase [Bacteroidota bacterium]